MHDHGGNNDVMMHGVYVMMMMMHGVYDADA